MKTKYLILAALMGCNIAAHADTTPAASTSAKISGTLTSGCIFTINLHDVHLNTASRDIGKVSSLVGRIDSSTCSNVSEVTLVSDDISYDDATNSFALYDSDNNKVDDVGYTLKVLANGESYGNGWRVVNGTAAKKYHIATGGIISIMAGLANRSGGAVTPGVYHATNTIMVTPE